MRRGGSLHLKLLSQGLLVGGKQAVEYVEESQAGHGRHLFLEHLVEELHDIAAGKVEHRQQGAYRERGIGRWREGKGRERRFAAESCKQTIKHHPGGEEAKQAGASSVPGLVEHGRHGLNEYLEVHAACERLQNLEVVADCL